MPGVHLSDTISNINFKNTQCRKIFPLRYIVLSKNYTSHKIWLHKLPNKLKMAIASLIQSTVTNLMGYLEFNDRNIGQQSYRDQSTYLKNGANCKSAHELLLGDQAKKRDECKRNLNRLKHI